MSMARFVFRSHVSPRRSPDPVNPAIEEFWLKVPARSFPEGLPLDANARTPRINRRVYREVEASLLGADESVVPFHLKNKGVVIHAERAQKTGSQLLAWVGPGQGITDGGHTAELILKNRDNPDLPDDTYVTVVVRAGVPTEWIPDIAGGLNTGMQVQPMSLDNLKDLFQWIKDEIREEPYAEKVAWQEGDDGEVDARDLVALLTLFNIYEYPNSGTGEDGSKHPVEAYEKKSRVLEAYEANAQQYQRLRPILRDILILHDTIRVEARTFWNEKGGSFGRLSFVESRKRGEFVLPFTGTSSQYRLMNSALYPILAAFRWMVEDQDGVAGWRGGFTGVLEAWHATAYELMRLTVQANADLGHNPNALGKSRAHWSNCHARVAVQDLMRRHEPVKRRGA